jgi:hypothetical protein
MENQTAVEWLHSLLQSEPFLTVEDFNKAKELEKQQTLAFGYRCIGEVSLELGDLVYKKVPEEVYNDVFKPKEETKDQPFHLES